MHNPKQRPPIHQTAPGELAETHPANALVGPHQNITDLIQATAPCSAEHLQDFISSYGCSTPARL